MSLTTYEVGDDGVALLRLDRPDARNAINTQMLEELLAHLGSAGGDEAVRSLVLSSTDHMGLSAGADVREQLDDAGNVRRMELFARLYDELTGFAKPTVAACHGACVGGGAEIAVACDLRVGGSNLRLRFPGAALGVPVGPARLVTLCGLSVAKYLLLTSKEVAVDDAHRWGLVHKVVPAPRTEEAALQLAAQVAEHPPEAVARMKRMLHEWDGVEQRSLAEGKGQVRWAGTHSVPADAGKAAKPPQET
ncbi:MAG: enoyl-CoA hydratase/isomerase family protein [Solirubrobacterales bacterium]